MFFDLANLVLSVLTLVTVIIYAYFTYLIARDVYEPLISFKVSQINLSHLRFSMINKSKVEVEVFCKLWSRKDGNLFEERTGFYGDKTPWILQPFTEGNGHFELRNIKNQDGIELDKFVKDNKISSLEFNIQIRYRKVGSRRWKRSSPQKFVYDFNKNLFWLNV